MWAVGLVAYWVGKLVIPRADHSVACSADVSVVNLVEKRVGNLALKLAVLTVALG